MKQIHPSEKNTNKTRKSQFNLIFLLPLTVVSLQLESVWASQVSDSQTSPARCYQLSSGDSPARSVVQEPRRVALWCYEHRQNGNLFIYNADFAKVRPELAMLQSADGVLSFASLQAGHLNLLRLKSDGSSTAFSPLNVSLTEPIYLPETFSEFSAQTRDSAIQVYEQLAASNATVVDIQISEGRFGAAVSPSALPWRGYWWPYEGQPLSQGPQSPMAKYDRYVISRGGGNPRSVAWENRHHRFQGVSWEGHCNGWVSSAILRAEPRLPKRDVTSGLSFSVSDQKGLLAEKDYCSSDAFFGHRYRGLPGDDITDIYPAAFHNALTAYINMGKPVALDTDPGIPVDNNIISAYSGQIQKRSANTYEVSMRATIHRYDDSRTEVPNRAPIYYRTFHYLLNVNSAGQAVSGRWLSRNPDFLWVPLSLQGNCSHNNPAIQEQWIEQILNLTGDEI